MALTENYTDCSTPNSMTFTPYHKQLYNLYKISMSMGPIIHSYFVQMRDPMWQHPILNEDKYFPWFLRGVYAATNDLDIKHAIDTMLDYIKRYDGIQFRL